MICILFKYAFSDLLQIGSKFGHQNVARENYFFKTLKTLELWKWSRDQILNRFATNQKLHIWIKYKLDFKKYCKSDHQMAPVALVPSWRDNSSYGVNTLGPLCLWQCFVFHSNMRFLICCKSVQNLVSWSLPKFQSWPPGWVTLPRCLGMLSCHYKLVSSLYLQGWSTAGMG